ncbi:ParB N-terminal domain-containing protein [Oceaniovalibus sp. ACAM 378]|uniref:ParB/RepB/Spo0J family partition protein n=1 Tax=Oceaniovalibus sp. ACAM 378 TaxID=2599923 RepID=UPI0011DB0957|nr:ParB N-terminal domain-containing protein [Oceaniovalibus sp. ACAM 378]TYB84083.1 chromosome partitioning protein [Oceaniovalibus sp. ACAM 378]
MAKRKRLSPARPDAAAPPIHRGADAFVGASPVVPDATAVPRPPIAHLAGAAAASSAFDEVSGELSRARAEGRMVLSLPLAAVVADHLIRDRVATDSEALEELKQSLMARGQQTPVEVVDLGEGRYGLISGWRRLLALHELSDALPGGAYDRILALVKQPADRGAAYIAMVEENEIRAGLSFYERARIVLMARQGGVFDSDKQALQSLFANVSYARRSKIKTFMTLVAALDGVLRFPARIPERTGLALSAAMTRDGFTDQLIAALHKAEPQTPEAEAEVLAQVLSEGTAPKRSAKQAVPAGGQEAVTRDLAPGTRLTAAPGKVVIRGGGVDPEFLARLDVWLATQFGD